MPKNTNTSDKENDKMEAVSICMGCGGVGFKDKEDYATKNNTSSNNKRVSLECVNPDCGLHKIYQHCPCKNRLIKNRLIKNGRDWSYHAAKADN